ncbi:MAG: carbon-nitrogen hydrolase family protein [Paracoccus sp. (in: a-proteobacteria)]|nr:carbon-nitrogen hydrolase family protein [Paracoccus sp. (in: a-proteobacteria)]
MAQPLTIGLIQTSVCDDVAANLEQSRALIAQAADGGASLVLTPECTNIISGDRDWQARALRVEGDDPTLAALRQQAADLGIWLLIGSLSLRADEAAGAGPGEGAGGGPGDAVAAERGAGEGRGSGRQASRGGAAGPGDGRFVNRSLLIAPDGGIAARYDKIHMFDVTVSDKEAYRESASYRPGRRAVVASGPVKLGLSICYDVRFAHLYRALGQAGAQILTVPAAFNDTTGAAHWHVLLRARAIETGCFVLAPAQCGLHGVCHGRGPARRRSYGHSLIVSPWGEVLLDAGESVGAHVVTLDLAEVGKARSRIPAILTQQPFENP